MDDVTLKNQTNENADEVQAMAVFALSNTKYKE